MSNALKAFKEIKRFYDNLAEEDAPLEMDLDGVRDAMLAHYGIAVDDTDKAVEQLRDNNIVEMYWEGRFWITPGRQWGVWEPK
ncbi:hypothetical protein [Corynebacterium propinquum]